MIRLKPENLPSQTCYEQAGRIESTFLNASMKPIQDSVVYVVFHPEDIYRQLKPLSRSQLDTARIQRGNTHVCKAREKAKHPKKAYDWMLTRRLTATEKI